MKLETLERKMVSQLEQQDMHLVRHFKDRPHVCMYFQRVTGYYSSNSYWLWKRWETRSTVCVKMNSKFSCRIHKASAVWVKSSGCPKLVFFCMKLSIMYICVCGCIYIPISIPITWSDKVTFLVFILRVCMFTSQSPVEKAHRPLDTINMNENSNDCCCSSLCNWISVIKVKVIRKRMIKLYL